MDNKLQPEGIRPVFPSHPRQIAIGYPVAANTRRPIRNEGFPESAICTLYCIVLVFVVAACTISYATITNKYIPELPSISIKSISMTVITNASDTQVKANLEMLFDPVENKNKHNSIIYDRVIVTAFDVQKGLFSDATFEQRGRDKRAVVVRMENVTVDVSEYEQHIYGRYGVSYLNFTIAGFVRIEGGKWVVKHTSSMRAGCGEVSKRVVFPLFQWNQTQKLDFQPNICEVDGDWKRSIHTCEDTVITIAIIYFFLGIPFFMICWACCCHTSEESMTNV